MTSLSLPTGLVPRLRLQLRAAPAAWAALGVGAAAIGVYYLLSSTPQSVWYEVIGAASVLAASVGIIRNLAPGHRLPWWLFTAGMLMQVGGDVVSSVYEIGLDREPPVPSLADAFYLGGYPLLAGGVFMILRRRGGPTTQAAVLDAVIVFLAVALAQWVFFIDPFNHDHTLSTGSRLTAMAYPAMDALLLVGLAQLMTGRGARARAYKLLVLSLGLWVVADEIYGTRVNTYTSGGWLDAFWLASYVCWAAAVLDPSVAHVPGKDRRAAPRLTPARMMLLAVALLMAPASLLIERLQHHRLSASIGIFGALIAVAVLARFGGLIRTVERARMAEREARHEAETARRLLSFQNEQLRQLDRLKDEFVSSVSHELRTPLTSITGYVELLRESEPDEVRQGYLQVIDRNAGRLLGLVSDILFAARVQDGRLSLEEVEVDMQPVAERAVEEARPRADSARIELALHAGGAAVVRGEPARLAQLLDNLVSNAIKFTPSGGKVDVRVTRDGSSVRIEVTDTGVGIPAADRERLFERFFRSQNVLEREIQGTGLGLYISKAIVDAHRGRIGVDSVEGKGTTFVVELPAS